MSNNLEIGIGEKIKFFRKKREITQEQLADYLNISFQSVSKWECGDAYPDITMLPKIALFFGVTTDELLCIDKLKEKEEIDEYITRKRDALSIGHTREAVEVMREANSKYPGNFRIMHELAYAMHTDAYSPPDAEYQQNTWKEIISIGEKIIAECRDNDIRQDIIEVMGYSYHHLGEKEKAVKLINENLSRLWVSRERMLEIVLDGDELIKQYQANLMILAELCARGMWLLSENFKPEDKISVLENIIKIYSMVFTDGDYGYYHIALSTYHIYAMNTYLELNNTVKFFENLKKASDLSIIYDNLPVMFAHTSPLVNKMVCGQLVKSYKGNQTYNLLKRLDEERYNIVREIPEFKEVCDELKKHAKDDD